MNKKNKHSLLLLLLFIITISCQEKEDVIETYIDRVNPVSAFPNDTLSIIGQNLFNDNDFEIKINGIPVDAINNNKDSLVVIIPENAEAGDISIVNEKNFLEASFELLFPKIDAKGSINNIDWEMKFGRVFGENFGSYNENEFSIILYSKDFTDENDPCEINSIIHGWVTFSVPRKTGTYSKLISSEWIPSEDGISFYVADYDAYPEDPERFELVGVGGYGNEAIVNIQSIQKNEIYGHLSLSGEFGDVEGNFIVNRCN